MKNKFIFFITFFVFLFGAGIVFSEVKVNEKHILQIQNLKDGTIQKIEVIEFSKKNWQAKRYINKKLLQSKKIREADFLNIRIQTRIFLKEKTKKKGRKIDCSKIFSIYKIKHNKSDKEIKGCIEQHPKLNDLYMTYLELFYK